MLILLIRPRRTTNRREREGEREGEESDRRGAKIILFAVRRPVSVPKYLGSQSNIQSILQSIRHPVRQSVSQSVSRSVSLCTKSISAGLMACSVFYFRSGGGWPYELKGCARLLAFSVWGFLMVTNWATFVFLKKAVCHKKTIKIGVSADLSTKKGTRNF